MRRRIFAFALLALAACKGSESTEPSVYELSRDPVSVRGWILDVKGARRAETMELEIARRTQVFQSTSIWVENAQYASGGVAENGAFIVLDVPPNSAIIGINSPGAETAQLVLKDIPGSADVFVPDLVLQNGGATVLDPSKIQVRLPGSVDKPRPTGKSAIVAGYKVPIIETPLAAMNNRRDYPNPPGYRPIATVK